jgi:hypothetical protein
MSNSFYMGCVVDRHDPLFLGRYRVRILGLHSAVLADIPTEDLPWATPIQPVTSSANSGIGWSPTNIVEGTWCVIIFADEHQQKPLILGTVAGNIDVDINKLEGNMSVPTPVYPIPDAPPLPVEPEAPTETPPAESTCTGEWCPLSAAEFEKWKLGIAHVESNNSLGIQNTLGYSGKYQFGVAALETFGYIKSGTWAKYKTNKILLDKSETYDHIWTGKNGVSNVNGWLASSTAQEDAMVRMAKANYTFIKKQSWFPKDPNTVPKEIVAGLLAVAHNQGPGSLKKLVSGQSSVDGYGTSVEKYYWMGYNTLSANGKPPSTVKGSVPTTTSLLNGDTVQYTNTTNQGALPDENVLKPSTYSRPTQSSTTSRFGFSDPSGKYPLKDMHGENDINRLARGHFIDKTCVSEKEGSREKSIGVGNSNVMWDEPHVPYAAVYPHNNVYATESGHIMEWDDTSGAERVHFYHTNGTFLEWDVNGNSTSKVKGTSTIIVDKDELVYIKGSGHVSIDGDMSVSVGKSCQIEVMGDANIVVHGDSFQTVDGNSNTKAKGMITLDADNNINIKSSGNIALDGKKILLNSGFAQQADTPTEFSPTIHMPSAPNRKEAMLMETENENNGSYTVDENEMSDAPAMASTGEESTTAPEAPPAEIVSVAGDCATISSLSSKVSTNYTLGQLTGGVMPTDQQKGGESVAASAIKCNLVHLAVNIIEPLRLTYSSKGFVINSCWRSANSPVNRSAKMSQHAKGQAVDCGFKPNGKPLSNREYYEIAVAIQNSALPYDQILLEYTKNSVWIHVSSKPSGNRKHCHTLVNHQMKDANKLVLYEKV